MNEAHWNDLIARFRARIESATRELERVPAAEAAQRRVPTQWSRKEIVGHLVDSASNNHQRFVRARFQDELVFPGYEQDDWVDEERWQERDWREIVTLWSAFNRHLAHVMQTTSAEVRDRPRTRHNLDQIAFKDWPLELPATLGWFMADYVDHLEHHLRQAGCTIDPWPSRG